METILHYLYEKYAPQALILYGSYADGSAGEGSDFDALILADREAHHDVSVVDGVQLDVWVYPADYLAADDALDEAVQIADGVVLHDSQGKGMALRARVRDYIAAQPGKSAGENEESLAWCRKMLTRSARADAEGLYRWHWLLTDSLEIACDLLHQPYCGPKKSLRWLENAYPDVVRRLCPRAGGVHAGSADGMGQMSGETAVIGEMSVLAAYLAQVQSVRETDVKCELSPALSTRMNDAALTEALICGLPMAQGVQHRILRSRGRGAVLTAKLRWRDGVRMLSGMSLNAEESATLEVALSIAADFLPLDEDARFQQVYGWVCRNVRYVHTAPGQKGYERLVSAVGALLDGQANCQGFADVVYLLCRLCGIACEYRCGRGERQLHVWNAVRVNGVWQEADASKGARLPTI